LIVPLLLRINSLSAEMAIQKELTEEIRAQQKNMEEQMGLSNDDGNSFDGESQFLAPRAPGAIYQSSVV
jgi:hypothetical protein